MNEFRKIFNSLESFILFALAIFMVMQFCMPSFAVFSFWFYLCIAAPFIFYCYKNKECANILLCSWQNKLLLLLFGYVVVHAIFFTAQFHGSASTIRHTLVNLIFLGAMIFFHHKINEEKFSNIIRLMLVILILCGLVSIGKHFAITPQQERLEAIGQNNHAILGANIYGLFALAGLGLLRLRNYRKTYDKPLLTAALIIATLIILLSQSRGPLISFGLILLVGLFLLKYYKLCLAISVASTILIADLWLFGNSGGAQHLLPLDNFYEYILGAVQRKSHRLEIWQLAWKLIMQHPFTGYGMQATFPYGYAAVNPHNLFLASWYYTGFVGFALLIAVTIAAIIRLWQNRNSITGFVGLLILLHGVLACSTDQAQMMKSPAPLWFIFWWGIAIAHSFTLNANNSVKSAT